MSPIDRVLVVCGPTASGKTALGLDLAERLGGPSAVEILNADSMQVYRGMDIGTAKLPEADRRGIAHRLFDLWPISHPVTVAEFQRVAREEIARVRSRGRVPMLVGGSGLYIAAVLDDLRFPGTDPEIRAGWEARLQAEGPAALHEVLRGLDAAAADRILPSNGRRIVRALEVIELTGEPFSATLPDAPGRAEVLPAVQLGVDPGPEELADRIAVRVEQMWAAGFVDEVRRLAADGLGTTRTAGRALGYAQILRFLRGECTEDEARQETITATRRFARRQRSWFRRDPRITWLDPRTPTVVADALRTIGA